MNSRRIRILHVLGALNQGGLETWLLQMLRILDREKYKLDFCCLSGEQGTYASEIEALGSRVMPCKLRWMNLSGFNKSFDQILRKGRYDAVHSHVHQFSGYILWRATKLGIPNRIAQSLTAPPTDRGQVFRHVYLKTMEFLIRRYATVGLGNSEASMISLFGNKWHQDSRWKLVYLGTDLAPFRKPFDRAMFRQQHGIPVEAVVLGHLGRFVTVKNHRFLIEVFSEIRKRRDEVFLVMVGGGPLLPALKELVSRAGIGSVVFTGATDEVPRWLRSMDLFVFPSLWEGLPQALIEAQAAGLRCLSSDAVTSEVLVIQEGVTFLPLSAGKEFWADVCLRMLDTPKPDQEVALQTVERSPFAIENAVKSITDIYISLDTRCNPSFSVP